MVFEVELTLREGEDPRALGGAVTTALCGHWENDGPCRWPHNNALDDESVPSRMRTIVVVPAADRKEVEKRIETALRSDPRWSISTLIRRSVNETEAPFAQRLAGSR